MHAANNSTPVPNVIDAPDGTPAPATPTRSASQIAMTRVRRSIDPNMSPLSFGVGTLRSSRSIAVKRDRVRLVPRGILALSLS